MNDTELARELLAEIPPPAKDYWQQIDASLNDVNAVDGPPPDIGTGLAPAEPTSASAAPVEPTTRRRIAVWPLAVAAALVLIAGWFVGNRLLADGSESVDTGLADDPTTVNLAAIDGPQANWDHWHAIYSVWDCTAHGGAGGWLDPFESDRDDWGIHSHQDGLMHIHPFSDEAAGHNSTFGLFAETMGIDVTDEAITLDDGRVLAEGTTCNGLPARVHLRRWTFDLELLTDPAMPPEIITEQFDEQRFLNDREVWVLAFAPLDADLPLPPEPLFALLNQHSAVFDLAQLPDVIEPGFELPRDIPEGFRVGIDPIPADELRDPSLWDDPPAG